MIECNCEDTPLMVYCKKCGGIYLIASSDIRIELLHKNEKKLRRILKDELQENYTFFAEERQDDN